MMSSAFLAAASAPCRRGSCRRLEQRVGCRDADPVVQFWPELPFAGAGMFFVQKLEHSPGRQRRQTAARSSANFVVAGRQVVAEEVAGSPGS